MVKACAKGEELLLKNKDPYCHAKISLKMEAIPQM
jgi:hypothetical protein